MRRFVGFLVLVFFALPLGLSVAGCGKGTTVQYCNGAGYGLTAGQVKTITLASNLTATGVSLNYGQIGPQLNATAVDCFGNAVSVSRYTYSTTDMNIADVNPANGQLCGGTWNRNTGGGIGDYTQCIAPVNPTNHTAQIVASASGGGSSNPIDVYTHATVTSVVLGGKTPSCTNAADPGTDCCNTNTTGVIASGAAYDGTSCMSQNQTGQLIARVYANGTTNPADNITCQVGHVGFALQGATGVAGIDANGIVTFDQPGSALVTATVASSSSALNAGFVSTCPPASIVLSPVNQPAGTNNLTLSVNNGQGFTATVLDTNKTAANNFLGNPINGIALEFNSTLPVNFPTSGNAVTPAFPGSATITAVCQPPTCNPAPFSQIGYLGNGKPLTSNGITVTAPGSASTVLYMGSTSSQYIASEDFTTGQLGAPVKLPYTPNSMVISQDGSTIYMGSLGGLMTFPTGTGAVSGVFQALQGSVLAVAPNNSYAVITDPTRSTVSLVTSGGSVFSTFSGIGTRAQWTPDSNTLYVTTTSNQLLTYSTFIGWESTNISTEVQYNDVAVTVPSYGAYFAGPKTTEGRSACPSTTLSGLTVPPIATNIFTPPVDSLTVTTDRLAATTDGNHILGATVQTTPPTLQDIVPAPPTQVAPGSTTTTVAACPLTVPPGFFSATATPHALNGFTASAITGIIPASNSAVAAITYTGAGGVLPLYAPAIGAVANVALSGGATTAPVAGVFSTDNKTFYAGTSGDDVVHIIGLSGTAGTTGTDTGLIQPNLPDNNGKIATPNLIVQRARRATS